jgi:hypothetical protein
MAAVRQYRFSALITLDPAARDDAARGCLGGMHTCCLVQPCHGKYFPAVISPDEELSARPAIHAVVSIALGDGEAEAFFAPGQRFTIWADAVVGRTIQPDGPAGQGVISCPLPWPPPCAHDDRADGMTAGPAHGHRLAALGIPAAHDRGQRLAV